MSTNPSGSVFPPYPVPDQLPSGPFDFAGAPTGRAIYVAFIAVSNARFDLFQAIETETQARNALTERRIELIAANRIEGKNAEEREARLQEQLSGLRAALREAEAATRLAQFNLDYATTLTKAYEWMTRAESNSVMRVIERSKNGEGFYTN
jgi:uncharacterized membrane protein YgaE (UPF0421/DUF939 family)